LKEKNDLKICFVNISYRTNELARLQRRWHQILTRISKRGHKVAYVSLSPLSGIENPYVGYGLGSCLSLGKVLATGSDIFLANLLEPGVLAYLSKKLQGKKFVFDYTDHYEILARYEGYRLRTHYVSPLQNVIPKLADRVIVVRDEFRKQCLTHGVPESKITVIPDGVDTRKFTPDIEGDEVRERFGIAEDPLVVYVGKVEEYYNLDVVVKAASIVIEFEPSMKFLFVGPGRSMTRLKNLAKRLELSDSVIFAGYQPYGRIPDFMGAADVAVFPHPQGLAVCEYMACGKPIVKPKEETGDMLEHLKSGFLIEDRTPQSFAGGIIEMLRNRKLAARLGYNARSLAVEKYDWEFLADRYVRVLQSA